ncbi:HAD-like domain-containing protein [Phycomyces nitens]|nr:HAD-like domain-containing protein [Phycomyces nitens]
MSLKLESLLERKNFIDKFDNFLFDCDGVLWEGDHVFPGIIEAMQFLRKEGKKVFFVTNNSTKSRAAFLQKFKKLGIEANLDEIFSSAVATAAYLKHILNFPADKKVYIIGMAGIQHELEAMDIRCCGGEADNGVFENEIVQNDPEVGAVVVGLDTQVNYKKYNKAFTYLRKNPGCHFIMTNQDSTFPVHGTLQPGAGSIAAPLITALNRQPDAILGKPAQNMMDTIFAEYKLDRERTCMIGDRLDTDIDFGLKGGVETLCVLTGVTSEEEILSELNLIVPTYYIRGFADFIEEI